MHVKITRLYPPYHRLVRGIATVAEVQHTLAFFYPYVTIAHE